MNRSKGTLQGPPGIGFTFTRNGNFNIKNRKLSNVASAVELSDAVNLKDFKSVEAKVDKIDFDLESLNTNVKKLESILNKLISILKKLENSQEKSGSLKIHNTTIFASLNDILP